MNDKRDGKEVALCYRTKGRERRVQAENKAHDRISLGKNSMAKKTIRVHLFALDERRAKLKVETVLESISSASLEDRLRPFTDYELRIDQIEQPSDKKAYWLMDFGKFRWDGPGQGGRTTHIKDITLTDGHSFAEDTAALFVRGQDGRGWLLVQHNHNGARASAIEKYLSIYLNDSQSCVYELSVKMREDAFARLEQAKHFTKIRVKVATASLTSDLLDGELSIQSALAASMPIHGDYITIEVSTRKRKEENGLSVLPMIEWLKKLARSDALEAAEVKASDGTQRPEPIDLLEGKLSKAFDISEKSKGRITQAQRWNMLERALADWQSVINP